MNRFVLTGSTANICVKRMVFKSAQASFRAACCTAQGDAFHLCHCPLASFPFPSQPFIRNAFSLQMLYDRAYFGHYGRVKKISVNRAPPPGTPKGAPPSGSAYVTYHRPEDAQRCIDMLDGAYWEGRQIRAAFGTTKYCNAFLKNVPCNNPDCLYLHDVADDDDSYSKDEMLAGLADSRDHYFDMFKGRSGGGSAGDDEPSAHASASASAGPSARVSAAPSRVPSASSAAATSAAAAHAVASMPVSRQCSACIAALPRLPSLQATAVDF